MRSPNYPETGLSEAIRLVRELWNKEKRTPVTAEVAVKAMGYKSLNGATRSHVSALRKYGLIEGNDASLKVSELAMRIIHGPDGSEERQNALQEAALKPELFKELSQTHAEASDEALKSYLLVKRGFSEAGARQFIGAFRDTLSLAKAAGSGYSSEKHDEEGRVMTTHERVLGDAVTMADSARGGKPRSYSWALSKDVSVELRIMGDPLTKAEAERLRQYIDLTMGALVAEGE